jgi:predicted  nucleic acid-binding Zn ribbon protein
MVVMTYILLESPVRCGDCFGTIPLYKLPKACNNEYCEILSWESDYKACDTLQMNCSTGERFAIIQMSKYDSILTKRGLDICNRVKDLTGKPMYYYLYRQLGLGKKAELKSKCPSCYNDWLLKEQLYGFVDFRCDNCNLMSNIAWDNR